MNFTINQRWYAVEQDRRTSLLDLLRDHLEFTGAQKGCDQGPCTDKIQRLAITVRQ